jgi:serine/threonine protein kinase
MLSPGQALSVAKAINIAAQVAEGLGYAHEHHVVHRDIKPANILITAQGRAKIADFGIARMRSAETRTQTGVILGSPKYLSPEQVVGKRADHRSDIFSLGVILYQCLTGGTPFNGEGVSALMYQITNHNPPPPSTLNPDVPVMLDYIVAKSLAKSVDERYQSAEDFAADLRECAKTIDPGLEATNPRFTTIDLSATLSSTRTNRSSVSPPERPTQLPVKDPATDPGAALDNPPTRGLSRDFDSSEATQRLLVQTQETQAQPDLTPQPLPPVHHDAPATSRAGVARDEHPWGVRENRILIATVVVALVIAIWILMA